MATDAQLVDYARKTYGFLAFFLDHPEIRKVLVDAQKNGWTEERIKGALVSTNFWKKTSESQRQWDFLKKSDPATANAQTGQRKAELQRMAKSMGVTLTGARLSQMANDSLRNGTTQDTWAPMVAAEFDYNPDKTPTGAGGAAVANLKEMADAYLIPLSEATIEKWTQNMLSGYDNADTFKAYLTEQAKSQFPGLTAVLDRGLTVRDYAEPYVELAAKTWEISPEDVNLNDPKFTPAFGQFDAKTGSRSAMSLADWGVHLRKQPEFRRTRQAMEASSTLAETLLRTFGEVA